MSYLLLGMVVLALIESVAFIVIYHHGTRWEAGTFGAAMMAMVVSVAVTATAAMVRRTGVQLAAPDLLSMADGVALVGWVGVCVSMAWKISLLRQAQQEANPPTSPPVPLDPPGLHVRHEVEES